MSTCRVGKLFYLFGASVRPEGVAWCTSKACGHDKEGIITLSGCGCVGFACRRYIERMINLSLCIQAEKVERIHVK